MPRVDDDINSFLLFYLLSFLMCFLLMSSKAIAGSMGYIDSVRLLRPLVSVGGGLAISSDVGAAKTFPIVNPVTDEFFIYNPTNKSETRGAFDALIGAEWDFHSGWILQGGLGYNQVWNFEVEGSLDQGADNQSADQYSYQYDVVIRQILAEEKLLYRLKERYLPYTLIGVGVAFNDASHYQTTVPPFLTFTRQYQNNTHSSFTYTLGAGLDVDISHHLRIGGGYRFKDFGKVSLGQATIDNTSVSKTLSQSHLYVNELLLQLTCII